MVMQQKKRSKERLSGKDRKSQIMDTALTLFAQKGFTGTRTREIAEAAGISETLIFQHFKTKDDLIRSSLASLIRPNSLGDELREYLNQTDDEELFSMLAMHFIKHNREDSRIMKLVIYSSLEGGHFWDMARVDETRPSILSVIGEYIQKRIDEGVFIKVNAEIAARLFVEAVFMYLADQAASITGPQISFSDDEVVSTLVKIYLDGLKKN
jgi:TetR/AcrR family transcriptional regulator